ncbi:putative tail tubular protein B [Vibrio phage vB_VpaP_G1]|uniref:Tail tubular protein B n=1 Tax=Vibrio phage vB_VpaP_G1 TaxID=2862773 RepID=A0AAE7WU29_9CAUD|nr:tail protein [Vibrio phage vB_VpaP_G1]QYW05826.1 putative tail tubular protein B [Vibrio phage vB_VpaP_G1]
MAGVNGRYDSVILGVSQQTVFDRREGQMEAQDNFISDPVRGLARRWGSELQARSLVSTTGYDDKNLTTIAGKFRTKTFHCDGREYELIYAKEPVSQVGALHLFDRDSQKLLNVVYNGALADSIKNFGISSLVNVGRFMLMAVNNHEPTYLSERVMPSKNTARPGVIWIRQGTYSRTYRVTVTRTDGSSAVVEHKTMSSAYEGVLDTSDIPWSEDGKYTKAVADRTNDYNTKVTQHIAESTEDIQPDTIAKKFRDKIAAQLGLGNNILAVGPYIYFNEVANITNVTSTDGGDSTYIRSVVDTIDDIDKLSPWHYNGKVMRISPKKQSEKDTYYVQATTKTGEGFGEVTWKECPGVRYTPKSVFCIAWADGDTLYVGSSPDSLNSVTNNRADCPKLEPSVVGDDKTSPLPYFLTKKPINYLGIFQDRLIIASGAVTFTSRPGDYFNWFRQSVLTVEDDDPVEMFALGSEDDVIRWDSSFDRNHILHGDKNVYLIPGRQILTPKNPSIQIMQSLEDSVGSEPKSAGSYVFFTKGTTYGGSLHQIQMGASTDSSDSYECSQQLDTYINGRPCEVVATSSPYFVILRMKDTLNQLFFYSYLDSMAGGERLYDSWSRWTWDELVGACCGISYYREHIMRFTFRRMLGGTFLVADKMYLQSELSPRPYLDSMMRFSEVKEELKTWPKQITDNMYIAYDNEHEYRLLGCAYKDYPTLMPEVEDVGNAEHAWVGFAYDTKCVLTPPFIRDRNGKSIINGRLTLSNLTLSLSDSAGVDGYVTSSGRRKQTLKFEGRLLTRSTNLVGRTPILDTTVKFPIYKEIRECQMEFHAQTWLPLTVSGIEWKGQFFNNLRRV